MFLYLYILKANKHIAISNATPIFHVFSLVLFLPLF